MVLGIFLTVFLRRDHYNTDEPYLTKTIFKSPRAFGNDHFDIYKIEAKKNKKIDGKSIDNDYYKKVKSFKQLMSIHKSEIDNYNDLYNSIDSLEKENNTIYFFEKNADKNGHIVMYIYNSDLDEGYMFDFQI